jgi:chromosome segregation ATPase
MTAERDALRVERHAFMRERERAERQAFMHEQERVRERAEQAAQLTLLQDQLEAARAANTERTILINRLRQELRGAKNDLDEMRIENTDIEIQFYTCQTEVANLNLENARLRRDNRRLAEKMAEMEGRTGRREGIPSSTLRQLPGSFGPELDSISKVIGKMRRQVDEEVQRRCEQREEPMKHTRRTVECRICMDKHHGDRVTALDPCGHEFCWNCIKSHVGVQLAERRFPILCPICKAEGIKDEPGSA